VLIIRQFKYSLNIGKVAYIVFTVMFALLVFSRPDEWMTRYNANQYLSGNLKEFDDDVICHMSEDAWAGLSFYDNNALQKLFDSATSSEEIMQKEKKSVQDDFYKSLNLSAWELIYNVK
ncbi:MAG: DUF4173 domain-containing protein, partial [Oscillospiraceae bacterium]|nr:DUF4173 domain-containing protein [Oscillospiraceae bacterium]